MFEPGARQTLGGLRWERVVVRVVATGLGWGSVHRRADAPMYRCADAPLGRGVAGVLRRQGPWQSRSGVVAVDTPKVVRLVSGPGGLCACVRGRKVRWVGVGALRVPMSCARLRSRLRMKSSTSSCCWSCRRAAARRKWFWTCRRALGCGNGDRCGNGRRSGR